MWWKKYLEVWWVLYVCRRNLFFITPLGILWLENVVIPNYNRFKLLTFTKKIEELLGTRLCACSEASYSYSFWSTVSGSVWISLITENWKRYSKIIFKCVNSIVRPSFNLTFAFFCTYGSREQCTRPTEKNAKRKFFFLFSAIQTQPQSPQTQLLKSLWD